MGNNNNNHDDDDDDDERKINKFRTQYELCIKTK